MDKNKNVIPDFVKENLNSNTFGKIKLNLYKIISGKDDYFPDTNEIKKFVRKELRLVPELGKLYANLLTTHLIKSVQYSNLKDPKSVEKLLTELEVNPFNEIYLLELIQCPTPLFESIGVYVYCSDLLPEGSVYVITFLDEKFPEYILGRIEIRASHKYPSPMFSELRNSDWDIYDLTNYSKSFL